MSAHQKVGAKEAGSEFRWSDVTYGVGSGKKHKEILKAPGISGLLGGGEVCAILGPSGAGKTSLLNILANRVRNRGSSQRVGGLITLDGAELHGSRLRKRIAYVMQQDLLCATYTPRESLLFSANLRLPRSMPASEKVAMVEKMLGDLGLLGCADTIVGDEMLRGISGGEKKRTAIGIELVIKPSLVFLDEPTSGLDSFAAYSVIHKLAGLAKNDGCNVLTTIHQPSSEVFHLFDRVMLLGSGRLVYFGPIPLLSSQLADHGMPCPDGYNLADHALNLIQTTAGKGEEASAALRDKLAQPISLTVSSAPPKTVENQPKPAPAASFAGQLFELTKRELLGVWRNKPGLIASLLVPLLLNMLFALIFFQVGDVTRENYTTMSHFGGIAQVAIGGMFAAAQPLLLRFPLDRAIFLREYATSSYGAVPYFLSKSLVELPQSLAQSVITWLAVYWLMGFHGSILVYVLVFWVTGMAAASTALLVGCLASNPEVAQQAAPAIFVPQLLFAGFFIKTEQIPVWLRWAQYLCSLKYGINLLLINEFGESTRADWPVVQQFVAQSIIEDNDIDPDLWWVNLVVLLGLVVFFRTLAILALSRRAATFF